jgi:hypothetical protein
MSDLKALLNRYVHDSTPDAAPPFSAVSVRLQRRTRRRRALLSAVPLLLVAAAAAAVISARGPSTPTAQAPTVSAGTAPAGQSAGAGSRRGPLPDGQGSCIESYNLATLKQRAFAFDGTVTATADQKPSDSDDTPSGFLAVTFTVNEWFRGGDQNTVTITMMEPALLSAQEMSYRVGTRLLVTGEADRGRPLQASTATAWVCGFTHYYDQPTANAWRQTFKG